MPNAIFHFIAEPPDSTLVAGIRVNYGPEQEVEVEATDSAAEVKAKVEALDGIATVNVTKDMEATTVANEVVRLTIISPAPPTFTMPATSLGAGGDVSIDQDDDEATVRAALAAAMSGTTEADFGVVKAGGTHWNFTITFQGNLAGENIDPIVLALNDGQIEQISEGGESNYDGRFTIEVTNPANTPVFVRKISG